ncbi:MAG: O-antigen ligase family protein [Chitinophagaceae bacterium]|jgi:O-antigen ligase|nr:O-antigen ligase family protein [Chitinophagaceae bacterium]
MLQLFSRQQIIQWWLPSLAAVTLFISGIVLQQPLLLVIPFTILAVVVFSSNLRLLFFALLFAIPLSTEFAVTDSLSTDLPDEPMMLLLSASLIAVFLLKPSSFPVQIKKSSLFVLVLLQLIWVLVTVLFSYETALSIKYMLAKLWFLLAFVAGVLMFLKTKEDVVLASKMLIFSMLIPVVVSLVRHAGSGFSFESINDTLTPFFRNHVNYSALLVCLLPVLFVWYRFTTSTVRKWVVVCMVLFLLALFFAYSRGAWLCLLSGAVTWLAIRKKFLLSLLLAAAIITVTALFWLIRDENYLKFAPDFNTTTQHTNFGEHIEATYTLKDMSTMERFYRWIAGMRMVNEELLKGYGPNTFSLHYKEYTVAAFKTWVSNNEEKSSVHNYFLLTAIEQGIPGFIILCILLLSMFRVALNGYHYFKDPFYKALSMLCGVVLSMVVTLNLLSDLIETDKIGSIFFIVLGLLIQMQIKMTTEKKQMNL